MGLIIPSCISQIKFVLFIIFLVMLRTVAWRLRSSLPGKGNLRQRLSCTKLFSSVESKSNENYYITTPIYYVNGQPHLGHAYTTVVTDILARHERQQGKNVFFLTGTDEHGQKVEQSAIKNNKKPIEFADETSSEFRRLTETLGML